MTICEKYGTENNGLARETRLCSFSIAKQCVGFEKREYFIVIVEVKGSTEWHSLPLRCLPFSLLSNLPSGATDVSFT